MNINKQRFTSRIAVYLILTKNDDILLTLRQNTGFSDGLYSLASGHVEEGESIKQAMIREAAEEIGIILKPDDLQFVHMMQRQGSIHYIDIYFKADRFKGEPTNCEPDKCSDVRFFSKNTLPDNLVGYVKQVLEQINSYSNYSEHGFEK